MTFANVQPEDQGQNELTDQSSRGGKGYEAATRLNTRMDLARRHRNNRISRWSDASPSQTNARRKRYHRRY